MCDGSGSNDCGYADSWVFNGTRCNYGDGTTAPDYPVFFAGHCSLTCPPIGYMEFYFSCSDSCSDSLGDCSTSVTISHT
jgi:hypothetical protein